MYGHKDTKLILMPIVLNGHYHFLTLDIPNEKYNHYSLESSMYELDAIDMVSHCPILSDHIIHVIYLLLMM